MKTVIFLGDGMADEALPQLDGKTPLMAAHTPNMDRLAARARFGTFRSLPDAFPTSSDVANLSVLGYDLEKAYQGRGPLEAASQGIELADDEIAMRCNLITAKDGILEDYSGGQIPGEEARQLIAALQEAFGSETVRFHPGVSYRNLLTLRGAEYSADFAYEKPDDHPGHAFADLLPKAKGPESEKTVKWLRETMLASQKVLDAHPVNQERVRQGKAPANMAWFWSPGRKPDMPAFSEKYGKSGAIISAVDVIKGIGKLGKMEVIEVEGATGYIDTNYEGKALAGVKALETHDFVYVHVEGTDEVSHAGELDLKIQAISDFDQRLIGTFLENGPPAEELAIAVLPDHPVPVTLRKHTRVPVPVMLVHPGVKPDGGGLLYDEFCAPQGSLGLMEKDELMRRLFQSLV